jgi:DNA-nicking Smr family endonuclease
VGRKKPNPDRDRTAGRRSKRGKRRSIRYDAVDGSDTPRSARDPDAPPEIHLRKLGVAEALARLETQLRAYRRQRRRELLVVHGRGHGSPGQVAVLGPIVRDWCDEHPALVASWREAPPRWGGTGAIVVTVRL